MFRVNRKINNLLQTSFPPERILRNFVSLNSKTCAATLNNGMKAAVCEELGRPLQIKTLPSPKLGDEEVKIRVHYAAVNFGDVLQIQGKYQEKPSLPFIPGTEFSGKIAQISNDEKDFEVGDHVAAISLKPCALSEEVVLPKLMVFKIPKNVPLQYGAASLISYGTAWMALQRTANIQKGQTVFVTAAAGAVGLALVDLAANVFGCDVIGAVGSDEKGRVVLSKGAKHVINYSNENIRNQLKELTEGSGVDIALDSVGGDVFMECLKSLAFEGTLVTIGYAGGTIPKIPANLLLLKSCSVKGVYWGSYSFRNPMAFKESIDAILNYIKDGKISPVYTDQFHLEKANEAFEYLANRKSIGKVLIKLT